MLKRKMRVIFADVTGKMRNCGFLAYITMTTKHLKILYSSITVNCTV